MKTLHGLYQNHLLKRLFYCVLFYFFFFLVIFDIFLTKPVVTVNITVEDALAIPTGIPTTAACDTILKVPNDADSVMESLPA